MQKLTCIKRTEDEPPPTFLVAAMNPLKPFWPACERDVEHWADLVRAFNRLVGGVFFANDVHRARQLLEHLAAAAEADVKATRPPKEVRARLINEIVVARNAAFNLAEQFTAAFQHIETVDDVETARFHKRQARA